MEGGREMNNGKHRGEDIMLSYAVILQHVCRRKKHDEPKSFGVVDSREPMPLCL